MTVEFKTYSTNEEDRYTAEEREIVVDGKVVGNVNLMIDSNFTY